MVYLDPQLIGKVMNAITGGNSSFLTLSRFTAFLVHSPSVYQRDLSSRDDFNVDRNLMTESIYHPRGEGEYGDEDGGSRGGGGGGKLSPYCCLLTLKGTMPSPLVATDATGRFVVTVDSCSRILVRDAGSGVIDANMVTQGTYVGAVGSVNAVVRHPGRIHTPYCKPRTPYVHLTTLHLPHPAPLAQHPLHPAPQYRSFGSASTVVSQAAPSAPTARYCASVTTAGWSPSST